MAIREIIHLWDKEEINEESLKILRNPCSEVIFPLDKETKQEVNDLIDTFLSDEHAVGLAAPQIGIRKCFFVFDPKYRASEEASQKKTRETVIVVVNPKTVPSRNDLTWLRAEKEEDLTWNSEGCLSLPGILTQVPRLNEIKLKGFDINGNRFSKKFEDHPARIVQHEMDHLLGRVIIDYGQEVYTEESEVSIFSRLIGKIRGK